MILLESRRVISIAGEDRFRFLQGLITQDIRPLEGGSADILYSALLSPQGKLKGDFFLYPGKEEILLDVASNHYEALEKTLLQYKLRSRITILQKPELAVVACLTACQEELAKHLPIDPRHPEMGQRGLVAREALLGVPLLPALTYEAHRIALGIPDSADFIEERSYIAEYGLDALNAVSDTKGCYVGQEVVARTKHRGTVHKALFLVECESGEVLPSPGTPITVKDIDIGQLRTHVGIQGLAILRRDKLPLPQQKARTGETIITKISTPGWFTLPALSDTVG